jgi:adenylate kinase family enzyme
MSPPRRFAIVASASGNGKTTVGRQLAVELGLPFVELDSLFHGPNWTQPPIGELRAQLEPIVAQAGWVIDGVYSSHLGNLVGANADLIVWLDLPMRIWLPRLLRRTQRRIRHQEELWNGNRESWRGAVVGWNSLLVYAVRSHFRRRREWPAAFAPTPVVRLRTEAEINAFLAQTVSDSRS